MSSKSTEDYHTPEELIGMYPQAACRGWTAVKIGIAYKMGLLDGYHNGTERKHMILASSFRELLKFANEVTKKRIIRFEDEE